MTLGNHLKYTALASIPLFMLKGWMEVLLFFAGGILIDIDHYIFYVLRFRRFDPKGMFRYFHDVLKMRHESPYVGLFIFHTSEFFLITGILSIYFRFFFYILIGMLFHFALDLMHLLRHDFIFARPFSIIEHPFRVRRHRKNGYPYSLHSDSKEGRRSL